MGMGSRLEQGRAGQPKACIPQKETLTSLATFTFANIGCGSLTLFCRSRKLDPVLIRSHIALILTSSFEVTSTMVKTVDPNSRE